MTNAVTSYAMAYAVEQGISYISMARGLNVTNRESSQFTWMTLEFRQRSNQRTSRSRIEKDREEVGINVQNWKKCWWGLKSGATEHRASVVNVVLRWRWEDRGLTELLSPQTFIDCDSRIVSPFLSLSHSRFSLPLFLFLCFCIFFDQTFVLLFLKFSSLCKYITLIRV